MVKMEFFIFGRITVVGSTQPVTEISNRIISWGGGGTKGQGLRLITIKPSYADCLEIWVPQPSWTLQACNRPVQGLLYFYTVYWKWKCEYFVVNKHDMWEAILVLRNFGKDEDGFKLSWNFAVVHKFKICYYLSFTFLFLGAIPDKKIKYTAAT